MNDHVVNVHGRRGGRGLRPWLLIPKVLCVALLFGGVVTAWVLIATTRIRQGEELAACVRSLDRVFAFVIIPGSIMTVLWGILLAVRHLKVFWAMKWFRWKIGTVLVALPAAHLLCFDYLTKLQAETVRAEAAVILSPTDAPLVHLTILEGVLLGLTIILVWLIWLGRHKPRLGQKVRPVRRDLRDGQTSAAGSGARSRARSRI